MRWGPAVVVCAAMLAAGCSDDEPEAQPPTTAPAVSPTPSPSPSRVGQPARSARPFVARTSGNLYPDQTSIERTILWDLEKRVLTQAGTNGRIRGGCDERSTTEGVAWEQTCTIRFENLAVEFEISGTGSVLVHWRATQQDGPLTRAAVHRAWYERVAKAAPGAVSTAQCDAALPVRSLYVFGDTRYTCWYDDGGQVRTSQVTLAESYGVGFTTPS